MGIIFSKISPNQVLKDAPVDASSDALGDVSTDNQGDTQEEDPRHAPGEGLGDCPRDGPEDPMEDSQDEQKLISETGKVKIYFVITAYFEAGYDDNYYHIEAGYIDRLDARKAALFMIPDLEIDARNILGDYGYTQKREILEDSLWIEWKGGPDNSTFKVSMVCRPLYIGAAAGWPTHIYVVQVEKQVFTHVKTKKGRVLPMNERVVLSTENKIAGVYVSVTHANQAAKFRFFEIVDPMSRESWTNYREFCSPHGCWSLEASHGESNQRLVARVMKKELKQPLPTADGMDKVESDECWMNDLRNGERYGFTTYYDRPWGVH